MSRKLNIAKGSKWLVSLLVMMLILAFACQAVCATPAQIDLAELQAEQESLEKELSDMMIRISEVSAEQKQCAKDLKAAEEDVSQQYQNMKERIRFMYEDGNVTLFTSLLEAKSMADFVNKAEFVSTVSDYDRQMLEKLNAAREKVEQKKAQLKKEKEELEALQAKRLEKQDSLASEIQSATEELAAARAALASAAPADRAAAQEALTNAEKKVATVSQTVSTEKVVKDAVDSGQYTWNGTKLTRAGGFNKGPSGTETYYNLNMNGVLKIMRSTGNNDKYWVRSDGVKMLGDYVIVAANLKSHPRGSIVKTSLGKGIVCDTGGMKKNHYDIATAW